MNISKVMCSGEPAHRIAPNLGLIVVKLYIILLLQCVQSCEYSDSVLGPVSKKKRLKIKKKVVCIYSHFYGIVQKKE